MLPVLFWLAVVCCVVAQIEIVRSSLRARPADAGAPEDRATVEPRRSIEIVWTVAPAIALAIVLAATWTAIRTHEANGTGSAPSQPPVTIQRAS